MNGVSHDDWVSCPVGLISELSLIEKELEKTGLSYKE